MFRRSLTPVLLVLLGSAPFALAGSPRADITGLYHSNWDDVRLEQRGTRVTGSYVCCGGGTIEGTITEGRTLRYRWNQPNASGRGVWSIEAGRLVGTWGLQGDSANGGRWDLTIAAHDQIAN